MAYDHDLATRIRHLYRGRTDISEKEMFGGLGFFINGNMSVAVSSLGGIMVRIDSADSEYLVKNTNASVTKMRRRRMKNWLSISAEDLRSKRQLAKWVDLSAAFVETMPVK